MSSLTSPNSDLGQLEEDLILNQVFLDSLQNQEGYQPERDELSKKIKSIKQQMARMQPSLPDWGSSNKELPTIDLRSYDGTDSSSYSTNTQHHHDSRQPRGVEMSLPSRKRPRNVFDDEFETLDVPGTKSLRTPTPRTASPARSVDSFGTDFSDDTWLKSTFGNNYEEEKRKNEQYLKDLAIKREREELDAMFARQLQESWNEVLQPEPSQSTTIAPSSSHPQATLNANGSSFHKPAPKENNNYMKSEYRPQPPALIASGTSTPNSDDSGLVEISPTEWVDRYGPTQRQNLPTTMVNPYSANNNPRMPGAFPGLNSYTSASGASVYGTSEYNSTQYNSSTSSLGSPLNMFGSNLPLSNGLLGSSRMPFNLDNYPLPSSLSYANPEQTQEEIKDLLKHIRPDEDLDPEQLAQGQPEGLKFNLMPHQLKGLAWMKSMEEGTNKGGILADDMGLGKTIQSIALILARPPALDERGRRLENPTLIVAPVALMQQWEREIKKMIRRSHQLDVLILHGSNRNSSWLDIKGYDIVLTTYGLLASDLKRKVLWDKRVALVPDAKPRPQEQCPVLGERSRFHRVILDEAQNIKNKSTKASTAACRIQSEYRWCLSGTPMQNSVDEIFSLIKFCRIRPYNDFEKFSRDIGRPLKSKSFYYGRDKAMQHLQALLRAVLLRRTKKSEIDGKPIIQLPEKHTIEDRTVFSKDELDFYKALETKAQIQFNKYLKNGTVGRNYSHALVLLLRLRQCCCSPQLITNARDFLVSGALQDLDYIENAHNLPKQVVQRLSDLDAFECPICMDGVENPIIFNPCGHSLCQECLSTMVDKAMADTESHKVTCPHCRAVIDTNKVTDHESFLRVHFPDRPGVVPLKDEDDDNDGNDDEAEVSDSNSSDDEITDDDDDGEDLKDFVVEDDDETEYDTDASEPIKKKAVRKAMSGEDVKKLTLSTSESKKLKKTNNLKDVKGKKKAKPDIKNLAQLRAEGLRSIAAKKKYIRRLGRGYKSSSKIEKTIQILKDVRDKGEGEKTIIFSSFTSFLDLLEVAMNREDDKDLSNYSRYDGSMSGKDRNASVIRFTDDPRCLAMLVSLKAGNAGLNLTAANHVIILDPFWNPFVEYQAADRCYRIGQQREVTIHRVLIGEADDDGNLIDVPADSEQMFTVEDRILALQEKKRALVETALDETASGQIGRLGTRELGYLFGVNSMD